MRRESREKAKESLGAIKFSKKNRKEKKLFATVFFFYIGIIRMDLKYKLKDIVESDLTLSDKLYEIYDFANNWYRDAKKQRKISEDKKLKCYIDVWTVLQIHSLVIASPC